MEQSEIPNAIQILSTVEIYNRGNVLTLFYAGTSEAMYKYPGAVFGISAHRAGVALNNVDAVHYPNDLNIPRTI